MAASRNISAPDLNLDYLTQALTARYLTEQYAVRRLESSAGAVRLKLLPSGSAPPIEVEMRQQDAGLVVTVKVRESIQRVLGWWWWFWVVIGILDLIFGYVAYAVLCFAFIVPALLLGGRYHMLESETFTIIQQQVAARPVDSTGHGPSGPGTQKPKPPQQTPPRRTVLCPRCGKSNPIDALLCANCRASLQAITTGEGRPSPDRPATGPRDEPIDPPKTVLSEDDLEPSIYDRKQKGSTNGVCVSDVEELVERKPRGVGSTVPSGEGDPATAASSRSAPTSAGSDGRATPARRTLGGVVLIVEEGGQRIAVPDKREALIGRRGHANGSGSFPDIDLTAQKGAAYGVSCEHARLLLLGGQVALEDLGAPNCTWVGDKQLIPGTPHPLRNGERLCFGKLVTTIQIP